MADDSGTCGENLTWTYTEATKILTISGTGEMTDYRSSDNTPPWNSYRQKIVKVSIGNGVKSIGNFAFDSCYNLTSITLPNSMTSISGYIFYGCSGLTSVEIPNSVTRIGDGAFSDCSGIISVTIPSSVTRIGYYAFSGCSSLTSITIGSGVQTIYQNAFASCTNLTDVYCYAENLPSTSSDVFKESYIEFAILHVPSISVNAYKVAEPWMNFKNIVAIDGDTLITQKCTTPTISYQNGKLSFFCETEGVTFCYSVTPPSSFQGEGNEVSLSNKYTVSVYAKKDGYVNSETVTKEIEVQGQNGSQDVNGDGVVDTQDVLDIYKYIQEH